MRTKFYLAYNQNEPYYDPYLYNVDTFDRVKDREVLILDEINTKDADTEATYHLIIRELQHFSREIYHEYPSSSKAKTFDPNERVYLAFTVHGLKENSKVYWSFENIVPRLSIAR